jgi:hypothetical protein
MDIRSIVRRSMLCRLLRQRRHYVTNSMFYQILKDSRSLTGLILLFVFGSIVRILLSSMTVVVKFLSFAVMFIILAWLVQNIISPSDF